MRYHSVCLNSQKPRHYMKSLPILASAWGSSISNIYRQCFSSPGRLTIPTAVDNVSLIAVWRGVADSHTSHTMRPAVNSSAAMPHAPIRPVILLTPGFPRPEASIISLYTCTTRYTIDTSRHNGCPYVYTSSASGTWDQWLSEKLCMQRQKPISMNCDITLTNVWKLTCSFWLCCRSSNLPGNLHLLWYLQKRLLRPGCHHISHGIEIWPAVIVPSVRSGAIPGCVNLD